MTFIDVWHKGAIVAAALVDGKNRYLGAFATEEEAGAAAIEWRRQHMPFDESAVA